jgi:hypothetical protein
MSKKSLKEIREEIEWYNPKKQIADAMLELGELGFEFNGHGCGLGGEDFGLIFNYAEERYFYFSLTDLGNKVIVEISDNFYDENIHPEDEQSKDIFKGSVKKGLDFIKKRINDDRNSNDDDRISWVFKYKDKYLRFKSYSGADFVDFPENSTIYSKKTLADQREQSCKTKGLYIKNKLIKGIKKIKIKFSHKEI